MRRLLTILLLLMLVAPGLAQRGQSGGRTSASGRTDASGRGNASGRLPVTPPEEEGEEGTSPTSYAMIQDREPRTPPALPSLGSALSTYTDPYFGTRVIRLTDASLDPASNTPISGANGTGQGFTTASSGDTQCISADGGNLGAGFYRIWVQSLSGTDYIYRVDATGADISITREPPSTNNPGDGTGMYLSGIFGEPEWSKTDGNKLIGRSGPLLKVYDFATDAYLTWVDVSTIGVTTLTGTVTLTSGSATISGSGTSFTSQLRPGAQVTVGAVNVLVKSIASDTSATAMANASGSASGAGTAYRWPKTSGLSSDAQAYGNSIAFVTVSDADTEGAYGTAHGGRVSARWGGALQDNHYVVAYWDQTNIAGTQRVWDQHRQEVGDGTTMTPLPDAQLAAAFDQNWGPLTSAVTTTGAETISVTSQAGSGKVWPEQGRLKLDSEEALYIKISESSLWLHTRGYNGTTAATHSSGATVTLRSLNSHSQQFDLSGRYQFITRSFGWNLTGPTYSSIFWDTNNDTFGRLSDPDAYSGHVSMGYATYFNPPANADALDWQIHNISAPNTNQALLTHVSRPTNSFVGDHTSTHNFQKTGGPFPFLAGTYRFAANAQDYSARTFREWDDALVFVSTALDGVVWRAVQHRTFGSADVQLTGTWSSSSGSTTLTGTGGAATTQLAAGAKVAINKESFTVVATPNDNSITVDHAPVASPVSNQTIFAFSRASSGFGFWYLPRASVARNGRFAVYTSNWQGSLGVLVTPADNTNHWRSDAFVVQFNVTAPAAPTITAGPSASANGGGSFTVTGTTSTPSDAKIFYGSTTAYGSAITGTVSTTSGSGTITGSGTTFTSLSRGQWVTGSSGGTYQVHEVVSNTSMRVQPVPAVTASGQTLTLHSVVTNYNLLTSHSNVITGASSGWHYKVLHRDRAGQQVASGDLTLP